MAQYGGWDQTARYEEEPATALAQPRLDRDLLARPAQPPTPLRQDFAPPQYPEGPPVRRLPLEGAAPAFGPPPAVAPEPGPQAGYGPPQRQAATSPPVWPAAGGQMPRPSGSANGADRTELDIANERALRIWLVIALVVLVLTVTAVVLLWLRRQGVITLPF
jgi:hypothetical protein